VTLDPTMFGQAELINATRLKDLLAKGNVKGPYVWTGRSLEPVELLAVNKEPPSTIEILKPDGQLDWQPYVSGRQVWLSQNGILSIGANTGGDGLRFLDIDINPLEIDFLEFDFASSKIGGKNAVDVFFSGKTTLPDHMSAISENRATIELKDTAENEFQKVRVRLSQCWRWFCFSRINQIALGLPHAEDVRIRNLRLVSAARLTPSIDSGIEVSSTGDRLVSNTPVTLRLKSRVEDAVSVRVEVGQRNFFFDNFANADMPDVRTLIVKAPEAVVDLEPALLNEVGYYQVRAIGIDKDGATIGEYSDSLTFYIQNPQ
ncbi:MAG: hypothetical protein K8F91_10545, partial [Candidatus Obscuribacterales bacterium]|nr:hypothetical protein [Candidatus Obscuribacterales bacterium]